MMKKMMMTMSNILLVIVSVLQSAIEIMTYGVLLFVSWTSGQNCNKLLPVVCMSCQERKNYGNNG